MDSGALEITGKKNQVIRKMEALDLEFAGALEKMLTEWLSENDEEAYADLEILSAQKNHCEQ